MGLDAFIDYTTNMQMADQVDMQIGKIVCLQVV